jgi:hypothetical protein
MGRVGAVVTLAITAGLVTTPIAQASAFGSVAAQQLPALPAIPGLPAPP